MTIDNSRNMQEWLSMYK